MTRNLVNLTEVLHEALADARAAGLLAPAHELEGTVCAAYATSSEYLGEVGEALTKFLLQHGNELPPDTVAKLRLCLAEVGRVWPKYLP